MHKPYRKLPPDFGVEVESKFGHERGQIVTDVDDFFAIEKLGYWLVNGTSAIKIRYHVTPFMIPFWFSLDSKIRGQFQDFVQPWKIPYIFAEHSRWNTSSIAFLWYNWLNIFFKFLQRKYTFP